MTEKAKTGSRSKGEATQVVPPDKSRPHKSSPPRTNTPEEATYAATPPHGAQVHTQEIDSSIAAAMAKAMENSRGSSSGSNSSNSVADAMTKAMAQAGVVYQSASISEPEEDVPFSQDIIPTEAPIAVTSQRGSRRKKATTEPVVSEATPIVDEVAVVVAPVVKSNSKKKKAEAAAPVVDEVAVVVAP
ncbi:MAG: hypothetical protein FWF06_08090, partial [Symbiobacteriaceae bacterium]|nr:hypothetical protein [Symbiobacteriaceae bacterium]